MLSRLLDINNCPSGQNYILVLVLLYCIGGTTAPWLVLSTENFVESGGTRVFSHEIWVVDGEKYLLLSSRDLAIDAPVKYSSSLYRLIKTQGFSSTSEQEQHLLIDQEEDIETGYLEYKVIFEPQSTLGLAKP